MSERFEFMIMGVLGIMAGSQPVRALMSDNAESMPIVIIVLTYFVAISFNLVGVVGFVLAWNAKEELNERSNTK